ncbi:MAG: D-alanyl-D-alanine carboxypeptidase/D-alanyl-D-alanine-endopeptidase [Methanococcaceae archaeon]
MFTFIRLNHLKAFFVLFTASLFIYGCAGSTGTKDSEPFANTLPALSSRIAARFDDTLFANAHWGVLIKSLKTGKVLYERNSIKMFNPASNQKIPSAAAALTVLGGDFTFKTDLCANGIISDTLLDGDLIVFGQGDPTLYNHFFKDPRDLFRQWAGLLRQKGIKIITGNIIGDDNAFDDEPYGMGWTFDDLDAWYSAEIGALQLNENVIDLKIIPPAGISGHVVIEPNLPSSYFQLENFITVSASGVNDVSFSRAFGTNKIILKGNVVAGSKAFTKSPSLFNPTLFYVTVLKEVLQQEGISVRGAAKDCDDLIGWKHTPADFLLIDSHNSPKLRDILKEMMKRSQNLYAETMPRILGFKQSGLGSFAFGRKVVRQTLAKFGIAPDSYAYRDGSGLSRYDYISPAQIVTILTSMKNGPDKDDWINSLPIAGVDGTLKARMKGTKAEGNVRAKTGTISNVRGLSGYVTTADGEDFVFSFIVNGHLKSDADNEKITDSVLAMIAEFDRTVK